MLNDIVAEVGFSGEVASKPHIPRSLHWALLIALIGPALTFVALPSALPQLALYFGGGVAGELLAQRIQAFPFLGLAVGGIIAGWALSRWGHARLLTAAAAGYCLAGGVGIIAKSPAVLLGGCALLGLTAALITCNLLAVAGDVLTDARRTRMLGFQTAISDFSTVVGAIAGALLAQLLGWHGPFFLYALYGAVMFALALAIPSHTFPRTTPAPPGLWRAVISAWPTYAAAVCVFLLVGTQTTQLPFLLAAKGFATPAVRSIVLTCSTLAAMVGAIVYGLGLARLGARTLRAAAMAFACIGFVGLSVWSGQLLFACLPALAIGLGIGVTVPSLFAAALHRVTPAARGHALGYLNSSIFLGSFLSPYVFTPLAHAFGYAGIFQFAALVSVALGTISLLFHRR